MKLRAACLMAAALVLLLSPAAAAGQRRLGGGRPWHASAAFIRGATFEMGTDAADVPRLLETFGVRRAELFASESPRRPVTLGSFSLDRYEVTNARFRRFLERRPEWRRGRVPAAPHDGNYLKHWDGAEFPRGKGDHPVVNVTWHAAVAFCRAEGKRLPTEAEWEYAARGGLTGKAFPWGDEMPDATRANFGASNIGATNVVGSYAANGYGLFDMAGNVWEFVADEWGPYASGASSDPVAGGNLFSAGDSYLRVSTRRVIRGGSYGGAPVNLRVAYRDSHPPGGARDFVGFRCAKSARARRPGD